MKSASLIMELASISWKSTIFHDGGEMFISPQFPQKDHKVTIRIRMLNSSPVTDLFLRTKYDGEEYNHPMVKNLPSKTLIYYEITLPIHTKHFRYRFRIIAPNEQFWFNSIGLQRSTPIDEFDFHLVTDLVIPKWINQAIFYQIFPDRFFDGDQSNNVKTGEISRHREVSETFDWHQIPGEYGKSYSSLTFYGGDIIGIQQKLDYLLKLGINAIYLNPIFTSPSNHKYDTLNYKEIDPHFGNNEILSKFVKHLHNNGIHIILDAVINHSSEDHPWFNRSGSFSTLGAYQSPESPYREYYYFNSQDQEDYEAWKGHKSLPRLNFSSDLLKDEVYRYKDSILQYWILPPYSVDGWRFDCANMVGNRLDNHSGHQVWREIRNKLKEIRPDCFLLGESFYDNSDLVNGDKLDAITNYSGFFVPLVRWLTQKDGFQTYTNGIFGGHSSSYPFTVSDLITQMDHFRVRIPFQLQNIQINLLDSHDVPRFFSLVKENEALMRLAVTILFTYPGIPMIYYGDEIGLTGLNDPQNRLPMEWREELWNQSLFHWYRRLIRIRKDSQALRNGSFQLIKPIHVDPTNLEILAYVRYTSSECFLIIIKKFSMECQLSLPLLHIGFKNAQVLNLMSGKASSISNGVFKINMETDEMVVIGKIQNQI
ncbi:MAG: alpha amylase N-terminal ig-like domain-containing protein [Promethearchaeota archaeon]